MHLKPLIQNADHIAGGDASTQANIDSLASELTDHRQAFERAPTLSLVKYKIVAPDMVRVTGPMYPLC